MFQTIFEFIRKFSVHWQSLSDSSDDSMSTRSLDYTYIYLIVERTQ